MRQRKGISPFLATVMLITITLMIGGVLYTQFRQTIISQVRNPSLTLVDLNVASDSQSITVSVKNDGNVLTNLQKIAVAFGPSSNSFVFGNNATVISSGSGGTNLNPGDILTAKVRTSFTIPTFSTFTLTVVGDQIARAFNVQA